MEIPWEDQLSYYSSSVNGSLRGKRTSEIQTEMVGYLKNRNAQFYYVLPLFSFCPLPCAMPHILSSSAQCWSSVFAKELDQGWNGSAVCICASSHLLGSVLQQHFRASQVDACSQDLPIKGFIFSFHNSSIFLGHGSLPGKYFINLRKRYPEVLYLIQFSCLLH